MQSIKNRPVRWRIWLVAFIIFIAVGTAAFILFAPKISAPSGDNQAVAIKPVPKPTAVSSNTLFTGNIYWGRYINDWSMASTLKYAYPFSRLNEFNRD